MDHNGYTPLHEAAQNGHTEAFKYLFSIFKDKNPRTFHHQTPLDLATEEGHKEIEEFIVQRLKSN